MHTQQLIYYGHDVATVVLLVAVKYQIASLHLQ